MNNEKWGWRDYLILSAIVIGITALALIAGVTP